MAVIIRNGNVVGAGGSSSASSNEVELTWAEYQALTEEEKTNGTIYYITDVDNDGTVKGYNGGTGIVVNNDTKTISTADIKKNYIDNSNFRINTRGQASYEVTDGVSIYTVDRWYVDGGILTPTENGVQFHNTNTESGSESLIRLKQNIPYTFADFAGKTITLSAKIDGAIYTKTATIPVDKPTEGTAIQYIAVGVPAFGLNLNYVVAGDYFVPYVALAYGKTILVEWMKLEVNDTLTTYIEPDYATEKIKTGFMNDDGVSTLPYTKAEVDAKVNALGMFKTSPLSVSTVSTATNTRISQITLEPGVWIIKGEFRWSGNGEGLRSIAILPTDSAPQYTLPNYPSGNIVTPANDQPFTHSTYRLETVSQESTYYFWAAQSSGSDINIANGYMQAVKLSV